jgi:hypothetical protein
VPDVALLPLPAQARAKSRHLKITCSNDALRGGSPSPSPVSPSGGSLLHRPRHFPFGTGLGIRTTDLTSRTTPRIRVRLLGRVRQQASISSEIPRLPCSTLLSGSPRRVGPCPNKERNSPRAASRTKHLSTAFTRVPAIVRRLCASCRRNRRKQRIRPRRRSPTQVSHIRCVTGGVDTLYGTQRKCPSHNANYTIR